MFPPDNTAMVVPLLATLPARIAATPAAPGGLDDDLRLLQQDEDGPCQVVVGDRDDLVDEVLDDVERDGTGTSDQDAVGDGRSGDDVDGLAGLERRRNGGGVLGLHTDDADRAAELGGACLHGCRDAGDQTSPADAEHDGVDVRRVLEEFESERSLPDHDVAVIERMDQHRTRALGELRGETQRGRHRLPLQHDFRSVAARGEQLRHRNAQRHEDRRRDAECLRRQRHSLRVVSR